MGALVTLELPDDSPVRDLPWIITIGPTSDDDGWEPVVCGPYERPHALALAQSVVADEDLVAVVEPLLPLTGPEAIRDEIALAQRGGYDGDGPDDGPLDDPPVAAQETRHVRPSVPPTEDEIRAGFARIAGRLGG